MAEFAKIFRTKSYLQAGDFKHPEPEPLLLILLTKALATMPADQHARFRENVEKYQTYENLPEHLKAMLPTPPDDLDDFDLAEEAEDEAEDEAEEVKKFNPNHGADGRFSSGGGGKSISATDGDGGGSVGGSVGGGGSGGGSAPSGLEAVHAKHFESDKKMHKESGYLPTAGVMAQRMESHLRDEATAKLKAIRDDAYMDGNHFGFRDNRDVEAYNKAMDRAGNEIPGAIVSNDGTGRSSGRFVPSDVQTSEAFNSHAAYTERVRNAVDVERYGTTNGKTSEERDRMISEAHDREDLGASAHYQRESEARFVANVAAERAKATASMAARARATPVASTPKPKVHATYAKAHESYQSSFTADGWTGSQPGLKTPHITSPDGRTRLWFKSQAVYMTRTSGRSGDRHEFKSARSITQGADLRRVSADSFKAFVKRWTKD